LTNIIRSFYEHRKQLLADDITIVARRLAQDYHSFCQRTDGDGNALFSKYQSKVMKGKLYSLPRPTSDKDESDTEDGDGSESPPPEKKNKR
jgi:hypothetical protein